MAIWATINSVPKNRVSITKKEKDTIRTVRATINSVPKNRVSINKQKKDTIRTVAVSPVINVNTTITLVNITATSITQLSDVDASSLANNVTLVYDETTEKFVAKNLPQLNGGTF